MSVQVSWLVEGHVIHWKVSGVDTMADVVAAEEEVIRLFDESDAPLVHVIFDFSSTEEVAQLDLKEDRKILHHPQNGWNIFVAVNNPILKMLTAIKVSQAKARLRWFPTLKEALEFLPSVDSSLPDMIKIIDDLDNLSS